MATAEPLRDVPSFEDRPNPPNKSMSHSDFAQVLFHNVADSYVPGVDIPCRYTLTPLMTPRSRDWVGLFKIGWSSPRNYTTFAWSPLPAETEEGKDRENCVVFKAYYLPNDDGEFYQFCYVTSSGEVRGASTPFQFKPRRSIDYVEVPDETGEMLVIKERTTVLEENLQKALADKEALLNEKESFEEKVHTLQRNIQELEGTVAEESEKRETVEKEYKECQEKLATEQQLSQEHKQAADKSTNELGLMRVMLEDVNRKLVEKATEIEKLRSEIRAVRVERDQLSVKLRNEQEEKELFKSHFTASELENKERSREIRELKNLVREKEFSIEKFKLEVAKLNQNVKEGSKKLLRQESISLADKEHMKGLEERLRNTEDKLAAAEQSKLLLAEELSTVSDVRHKVHSDLETAVSQADSLKMRLKKAEETFAKKEKDLLDEMSVLRGGLDEILQDKDKIEAELKKYKEEVATTSESTQTSEGKPKAVKEDQALFFLETAHHNLEERYKDLQKEYEQLQREKLEIEREKESLVQSEDDLKHQVDDLKVRLEMGAEAYREKYRECHKLEKTIKKLSGGKVKRERSSSTDSTIKVTKEEVTEEVAKETKVEETTAEPKQTRVEETVNVTQSEPCADEAEKSSPEFDMTELQTQLTDLHHELQNRYVKVRKYKQLYMEERQRNLDLVQEQQEKVVTLEKQLEEERRQRREEKSTYDANIQRWSQKLDHLRERIRYQTEHVEDMKTYRRSLEDRVEELQSQVEEYKQYKDAWEDPILDGEETEPLLPASSPRPEDDDPSQDLPTPPDFPPLRYPNPYLSQSVQESLEYPHPSPVYPKTCAEYPQYPEPAPPPAEAVPIPTFNRQYKGTLWTEKGTDGAEGWTLVQKPAARDYSEFSTPPSSPEPSIDPTPPLTPLPPPLMPTPTAEAKLAAIKAVNMSCSSSSNSSNGSCEDLTNQEPRSFDDLANGNTEAEVSANEAEAAEVAAPIQQEPEGGCEERWMLEQRQREEEEEGENAVARTQSSIPESASHEDEYGPRTNIEDYPQCPVCEVYFPPGCNEATYDLHVQSHYGHICPMCNNFFDDNTSEDAFIVHVQSHFDHEG
ncbi:TAX1BP1 [Branchiostoma lanceolatum]|uniref:TAX1BP1 protein n=1 Tax=Branchiostoma lanceolatum TaxID=7740 RepID=A0A8J9YUT7_BRALA|nr:TAX1BP1 [Branchiostoma lanceolatum]